MSPYTNPTPRRIVRTIAGSSTAGTDDIMVDDQGRRWIRATDDDRASTAPSVRATIVNGWVIP